MLRFALREAARFAFGAFGAVLVASAIAALATPGAWHATGPFFSAALARLLDILRLTFGYSAVSGRAVVEELGAHLQVTGFLVVAGAVFAILAGGSLAAASSLSAVRRTAGPVLQLVTSTPLFCAGLAIAWSAQHAFHALIAMPGAPAGPDTAPVRYDLMLLPALMVGAVGTGYTQLLIRRGIAQTGKEAYRLGLRRLGLSAFEIERVYVAPQILATLLLGLGELTVTLFAADAVCEWVFGLPGAAVLFVKAVALGDWNVVALVFLVLASITMLAEFLGRIAAHALTGREASW